MSLANECIPFYEPGQRITGRAKSAITGKRLVRVSGNREDGLIGVAHATAAEGKVFGVASHDAADGENVTIIGAGAVVPVTATAATISADTEVEVATGGKVVALSSGVAVGLCVNGAAANADAEIKLY